MAGNAKTPEPPQDLQHAFEALVRPVAKERVRRLWAARLGGLSCIAAAVAVGVWSPPAGAALFALGVVTLERFADVPGVLARAGRWCRRMWQAGFPRS